MNNNVHQMSDYRTCDTPQSNIYHTIESAKSELNSQTAEILPFEKPENDDLSDDDIEFLWNQAVEQSYEIIDRSERPAEVLLLITNLVDDLTICGVRTSTILSAVHRGFEFNEDRIDEMEAEAE